MYCWNCRANISDDSKFCPDCGARLADDAAADETASEIDGRVKQPVDDDYISKQHVKKARVYGDFGADLSEKIYERRDEHNEKLRKKYESAPEFYARREYRRSRSRKIRHLIIIAILIAWIIARFINLR